MKMHSIFGRGPAIVLLGVLFAACDNQPDPLGADDADSSVLLNRTLVQVDRFGLPAITTVFIPSGMKDDYNQAIPENDNADYTSLIGNTITNVYGQSAATADGLSDFVTPDIQPINTAQPTAFPNGRRLADDVLTTELMLIFGANADLNDDHVDANDVSFSGIFPYLASPHTQ